MSILALVLHVRLHRSPQCPDVPLTKTCGSPSLYQLQEEGVFCKYGLCKHLEQVPTRGKTTRHTLFLINPDKSGAVFIFTIHWQACRVASQVHFVFSPFLFLTRRR